MSLWDHQVAGVERIHRDGGVHALLWQPGAGKSATVVRYLEELTSELGRPIRVLIVCPKSVLGVWPQEFEKHARMPFEVLTLGGPITERLEILSRSGPPGGICEETPLAVCLLAYSTFSAKPHATAAVKAVRDYAPDVIVLDEAHAIKGAQSNTSKLLGKIGQLCPRRLILTGTPTPHSPGDVFAQWRFLDPSAFAGPDGKMVSWSRWLQGYAIMGGFQGRQIVGWRDIEDMEERMARKSSVVYTRDCHDLPELRVQKHVFELSPAERRAYDEMRRDLLTVVEDDTITATNKLVSVLRLRQVTSGFLPNEDGVERQVGTTRQELALGLIENLLASEKRIVVFAWSKHEVDSVYVALATARPWDTAVYRIAGDVSSAAREAALKCFADPTFNDRAVMVAQCDSLNSGTNALVGASHVLYLSLTNNAGVWQQSLARLHRPGQTADKVVAHVLQAANSIDQHMLDSLEGRVDMQQALMEHVKGRQ
jgi:SNF2 family DNA or RNA helicase